MTKTIKLKTGKKTIRILPSRQKLSAHAGQTTFWGFLHLRKVRPLLAGLLPHRPTSPNASKPVEIALLFYRRHLGRSGQAGARGAPAGRSGLARSDGK